MRVLSPATQLLLATGYAAIVDARAATGRVDPITYKRGLSPRQHYGKVSPKVMIISLFYPEADIWYDNLPSSGYGDLFAKNITVPGLSPIYPEVHCNQEGEICQMTAGESEINAASSIMGLVMSDQFDLRQTYFMIAGIAGVNPKLATLGSVALAKFSVQVALQYEFDAREMPANFSSGYFSYGTYMPDEYPTTLYGTEVMEVNEALRDIAFELAAKAKLNDTSGAQEYRSRYLASGKVYAAATKGPTVVKCDSATSDVYYSGQMLSESFEKVAMLWTNQTELTYCMTAQEDSAVLEVLMRATLAGSVDFSRIISMRTGSDFDRPPPGVSAYDHLVIMDQNGFEIAVENIYLAGIEIVKGILTQWDSKFAKGIKPTNYIGDIFGSLGGKPNFGPGSVFDGKGAKADGSTYSGSIKMRKRGMMGRRMN